MRAIIYGLAASFFFAFTFILNRSMDLGGGNWAWSASLRFFFMLPILFGIVVCRGNIKGGLAHLVANRRDYFVWSIVGFVFFYAPLCFAASFGEGWLVAATWQITIVAGPLLTPFMGRGAKLSRFSDWLHKIPFGAMRWSLLILCGIVLMQLEHTRLISLKQAVFCILPIIFAAFMYPLGNRKMMDICKDDVDTFQRVLNMTIASQPLWIVVALFGLFSYGVPSSGQVTQSLLVAVFSGVFATILFFAATNIVRQNPAKLASVEATQSGEIVFALAGELVLLPGSFPSYISLIGIMLVVVGMVLHSLRSA